MKRALALTVLTLLAAGLLSVAAPALAATSPDTAAQKRAITWEKRAKRARRHARQHARFLGKRLPARLARTIARPVRTDGSRLTVQDWTSYGDARKRETKALQRYIRATWRQIRKPRRIRSAASWLPLLKHEGWPTSQLSMALRVIRRESGGNPDCVGSGGYYGLFQISQSFSRGRWNLCNPVINVRVAKQLFSRRGWQPWASTAY